MSSVKLARVESSFFGRDCLTLLDYTTEEILHIIHEGIEMKKNPIQPVLSGKILAMIFEKSSTRTRVSFEAGMQQLGGNALFLSSQDLQLGRGESIADTAKVLSGYVDAIMIRTFQHEKVEELARHASIPVINGLTDTYHPCQALADLMTILQLKKTYKGTKVAYIGDGNNVAHSLLIACAKVGMDAVIAHPEGYGPDPEVMKKIQQVCKQTGAAVTAVTNPAEAVQGADIVYSDVWTSMGQEEENEIRLAAFDGYQINSKLMAGAKADSSFLHCLPAHRGEEVTAEVIDGSQSAVFLQAENRLHVQKALLKEILAG
ncbi:ornithine carbamoyltransferase [Metabacillus indicus]|uniref:Ornithine carbamoyltransferase n=1 Tax=Metabacillus indicus TaxID=246786 RepID=A0A084H1I3_METID|nr:ornithine carbamoyltransferase [Metabacillus indicus]KEZ53445.1 ornithine carbamoyltransferase [Metabacillus indicus]